MLNFRHTENGALSLFLFVNTFVCKMQTVSNVECNKYKWFYCLKKNVYALNYHNFCNTFGTISNAYFPIYLTRINIMGAFVLIRNILRYSLHAYTYVHICIIVIYTYIYFTIIT